MGEWIAIGASFVSILTAVCLVVSKFSKMEQRLNSNEERDREERADNKKKFEELYNSRNQTNENLRELTTTVKILVSQNEKEFSAINKKLDDVINSTRSK